MGLRCVRINRIYCTQLPYFAVPNYPNYRVLLYIPAVESGDEDEGEHEEEDGGDDHHDQRDLGLGQVLIGDYG